MPFLAPDEDAALDEVEEFSAPSDELIQTPAFDLSDFLGSIGRTIVDAPTRASAGWQGIKMGLRPPTEYTPEARASFDADKKLSQRRALELEKRTLAGDTSSVSEAFDSAGQSLAGSVGVIGSQAAAGAGTGALYGAAGGPGGAAAGTAVGLIGGMIAGGTTAYRQSGNEYLRDAFDQINEKLIQERGKPLTPAEGKKVYEDILPLAQSTGGWEALPEAIGNAISLGAGKYILGIGKKVALAGATAPVKSLANTAISALGKTAAGAGSVAGEIGTEAYTRTGQGWDEAKLKSYMRGENPDDTPNPYAGASGFEKAAGEVAPTTIAQQALMLGLGGGVKGIGKLLSRGRTPEVDPNRPKTDQGLDAALDPEADPAVGEFPQAPSIGDIKDSKGVRDRVMGGLEDVFTGKAQLTEEEKRLMTPAAGQGLGPATGTMWDKKKGSADDLHPETGAHQCDKVESWSSNKIDDVRSELGERLADIELDGTPESRSMANAIYQRMADLDNESDRRDVEFPQAPERILTKREMLAGIAAKMKDSEPVADRFAYPEDDADARDPDTGVPNFERIDEWSPEHLEDVAKSYETLSSESARKLVDNPNDSEARSDLTYAHTRLKQINDKRKGAAPAAEKVEGATGPAAQSAQAIDDAYTHEERLRQSPRGAEGLKADLAKQDKKLQTKEHRARRKATQEVLTRMKAIVEMEEIANTLRSQQAENSWRAKQAADAVRQKGVEDPNVKAAADAAAEKILKEAQLKADEEFAEAEENYRKAAEDLLKAQEDHADAVKKEAEARAKDNEQREAKKQKALDEKNKKAEAEKAEKEKADKDAADKKAAEKKPEPKPEKKPTTKKDESKQAKPKTEAKPSAPAARKKKPASRQETENVRRRVSAARLVKPVESKADAPKKPTKPTTPAAKAPSPKAANTPRNESKGGSQATGAGAAGTVVQPVAPVSSPSGAPEAVQPVKTPETPQALQIETQLTEEVAPSAEESDEVEVSSFDDNGNMTTKVKQSREAAVSSLEKRCEFLKGMIACINKS